MARPTKQGLEYFPMDVDADTDEKVEYLTAKCGFMAFGVYVHLLMKIYKNGYFLEWSDRTLYVTAKRLAIPADDLKKIIDGCIEAELFDAEIFNKFSVLTSQSIQKRYLAATEKRKGANIGQYSLLVVNSEITAVNSEKTTVNSEITAVNSELSTQSKVKESKVNNNNNNNNIIPLSLSSSNMNEAEIDAVNMYEDIMRQPLRSQIEKDMLLDFVDEYGAKNVQDAMKEAVKSDRRTLRYIEGILKNWRSGNIIRPSPVTMTQEQKAALAKKREAEEAYYNEQAKKQYEEYYGGAAS